MAPTQPTATMAAPATPASDFKSSRRPFNSISVNATLPSATKAKKSIIREWEKLNTVTTASTCESDETRTMLDKEQVRPTESLDSIFRTPTLVEEEDADDLLSLKRANPVFEEDEEEEDFLAAKRQRRSNDDDDTFTICWNDRIEQDEEQGYQIILQE